MFLPAIPLSKSSTLESAMVHYCRTELVTRPVLPKAKRKLTDFKEDDPKEPATKSAKINNDEPFEYLQQLINVFPNVSHQFLSQKAKEFEEKGDYFLQVIFLCFL